MGTFCLRDILAQASCCSYLLGNAAHEDNSCWTSTFVECDGGSISEAVNSLFSVRRVHVHSSRQARHPIEADHGGRGGKAAPRLRLRRHVGLRSVPDDGRFPRRPSRGLSGWIPMASASRHRDHHLCAGRQRRPRRQPRQSRQIGRRRRAVDDGRQRHPASGNADRRRERPHARLPALGQPAR